MGEQGLKRPERRGIYRDVEDTTLATRTDQAAREGRRLRTVEDQWDPSAEISIGTVLRSMLTGNNRYYGPRLSLVRAMKADPLSFASTPTPAHLRG